MESKVDLILLGSSAGNVTWNSGRIFPTDATPAAVSERIYGSLPESTADAWLFWDPVLGLPDEAASSRVMDSRGNLWHAGLRLGTGGLPGLIDYVQPTWMLNRDPDPTIEATSWRLTLRACLIPTEVLRRMGGPLPDFRTLEGAALEMGHRFVMHGVLTRHVPWLVAEDRVQVSSRIPFEDELRFIQRRFGLRWGRWALLRAIATRYVSTVDALRSWKIVRTGYRHQACDFSYPEISCSPASDNAKVSVLIPTLNRYSYLRALLNHLRNQTVPAFEIIVVDQTAERLTSWREEFSDLPLRILYLDTPGQCSARNAGLKVAQGEFILFLDDDEEVPASLIESHLASIHHFRADASCGVADERDAGPLPENFRRMRCSDVFPTNNTLICRESLIPSGLFDLAFDHGDRADGDLGTRVYLTGALMVLNPKIKVQHHHADRGGLRSFGARVITYASSRKKLTHRQLPSRTELYYVKRYFTQLQFREKLLISLLGTFSVRGSAIRRALKILISFVCAPHTLWRICRNHISAKSMLRNYPQIPYLKDESISTTSSLETDTLELANTREE